MFQSRWPILAAGIPGHTDGVGRFAFPRFHSGEKTACTHAGRVAENRRRGKNRLRGLKPRKAQRPGKWGTHKRVNRLGRSECVPVSHPSLDPAFPGVW